MVIKFHVLSGNCHESLCDKYNFQAQIKVHFWVTIGYMLVQQSTTVSCAGLPVLRTRYKPMSMHKRSYSQNDKFCVL